MRINIMKWRPREISLRRNINRAFVCRGLVLRTTIYVGWLNDTGLYMCRTAFVDLSDPISNPGRAVPISSNVLLDASTISTQLTCNWLYLQLLSLRLLLENDTLEGCRRMHIQKSYFYTLKNLRLSSFFISFIIFTLCPFSFLHITYYITYYYNIT